MRPIFVGNFEYDTRQNELERLFSKYGRVDRVDMKSGFAFVYFEDERDADDAIRGLDNVPFGNDRRRLSVEWAKGERGRHREGSKSMANQRPTRTLFVINFDPIRTRVRDIERHFEPFGKILNVRIRRNFAFVQYDLQEDATKALECTHMSKILDRVVSVEYALRDDDERGDRYEGSPRRGAYGRRDYSPRGRSPSPVYHRRPSPDYGRPRPPSTPQTILKNGRRFKEIHLHIIFAWLLLIAMIPNYILTSLIRNTKKKESSLRHKHKHLEGGKQNKINLYCEEKGPS